MLVIFAFTVLIIMCIATAHLLNTKFENAVPITFLSIIALLYFFAVLGALQWGVYACLALGAAGFIWAVVKGKKPFG